MPFYNNPIFSETSAGSSANVHWRNNLIPGIPGENSSPAIFSVDTKYRSSHGALLAVDIQPEIEPPVERTRAERAIVNLIGNAIEAMPEGGEVRIWAHVVAGSVPVHVDDTRSRRSNGNSPHSLPALCDVTVGKRDGLGLGFA